MAINRDALADSVGKTLNSFLRKKKGAELAQENIPLNRGRASYEEIVKRASTRKRHGIQIERSPEEWAQFFANEDVFFQTMEHQSFLGFDLFADVSNPLDTRIGASDLLVLYELLARGGLDRLCDSAHIDTENLDDVKQIVVDYIEHVREKNKEEVLAHKALLPVTIGLEVEYEEWYTEMKAKYDALRSRVAYWMSDGEKLNERRLTALGMSNREAQELISLSKLLFNDSFYHDLTSKLLDMKNNRSSVLANSLYPQAVDTAVDGVEEIKTRPALSYKTVIRDLLQLFIVDHNVSWNIHDTIGGIDLNQNHHEIMDALLVSAAAGFLPQEDFKRKWLKYGDTVGVETELHPKPSAIYSPISGAREEIYFPFHKKRGGADAIVNNYPHRKYDSRRQVVTPLCIEQRGILDYEMGEFPLLVRHLRFTQLAGIAIQAEQTPKDMRSEQQVRLAKSWRNFMKQWSAFLLDEGLWKLRNTDYYRPYKYNINTAPILYEQLMNEIRMLAVDSGLDFKKKARALVREFMAEVRVFYPEL